jgi:CHAT domain-containing protein/tetratricopeptide (TPR) repeat protein
MRQPICLVLAFILCWAPAGQAHDERVDARLSAVQEHLGKAAQLKDAGQYAEAAAHAGKALSLREAIDGNMPPDVASCLTLAGEIHRLQGELARAEPFFQRALALREKTLPPAHPDVASALNNLAILYYDWSLYHQAEPLLQRALAIREASLGKRHPSSASSLNLLALLYMDQGLYERAEPLFLRALASFEASLGGRHTSVAAVLNNLSLLYHAQGHYSRAEPLSQRALAIREAALGPAHPDVASSLNTLAILYKTQGLYGRAEPLYQRALSIWEAALGKNHASVADAVNNLAILYSDQGLNDRAEAFYRRALAIRAAALGKRHPSTGDALNNLALLYVEQGLYHRARPLLQRALAIREASLGKRHPTVAASLSNLAIAYRELGLYDRAEPLFLRALAVWELSLGRNHPDVAEPLYHLALLYHAQGAYSRAGPLYERALKLWETGLGNNHPLVAESLNALGKLRLAQHRLSEALPLFSRSFAISEQRLRHEALDFSESRLSTFLSYLRANEQSLYALLRAHPRDPRVQRLALSAVLLLKGRSISETAHISRTIHHGLGAKDRDPLENLRRLRTQLAALSLEGPGSLSPESYQQRLRSLTDEGDSLEAELAKRSAVLRSLSALPLPDDIIHRVAASLPEGSALVEFIAYSERPLVPKPGLPPRKPVRQDRYLALLLFPDASIHTVDLGPTALMDRAALRLHDALAERDASFQPIAHELYQRAFQPLIPLLGPTRRLFLSLDGELNLVPFSVLHDGQGFLLDTFDFTYLTSGRELLPRPPDAPSSSSIFVLADPDFASSLPAAPTSANSQPSASLERFFSTPLPERDRSAWTPLPGTRLEAQAIQRLLPQAQLFLGARATKERLFHLAHPGILHLATHGFFLGSAPSAPSSRGLASLDALSGAPVPQQEPLLNSGLVLAGALGTASAPPSHEATLVTALELAGLNLWGTQLVVLSACDTGRGAIHLGQGVYGLRRALMAAGAETILVSLWKVNDNSTHLLMDLYYRNLLEGQGRAAALRAAMRSLRATHPHPHAWAPFIALGSDAPLREIPFRATGPGAH